jgi:hypothetical protein
VSVARYALLALVCGCGSDAVVDGRPLDARTDADAAPWPCSVGRPAVPPRSTNVVDLAFDVSLPAAPNGGEAGAVAAFATDTGVLVFTPRSIHTVSADGERKRSVVLSSDAYTLLMMQSIVEGSGTYGAVIQHIAPVGPGDPDTKFCVIDAAGEYRLERCGSVGLAINDRPAVAFDGREYHVYRVFEGAVRRWTFDTDASLIGVVDLSPAPLGLGQDAAHATLDADVVITLAFREFPPPPACSVGRAHARVGDQHEVLELAPDDFVPLGPSVAVGGRLAVVEFGRCAVIDSTACNIVSGNPIAFLSVYRGGERLLDPTAVPLQYRAVMGSFLDGERLVATYASDEEAVYLSRFDAGGAIEISDLHLPLRYNGGEVHDSFAGVAIGPSDYAIVYTVRQPGAYTRLARFTIQE